MTAFFSADAAKKLDHARRDVQTRYVDLMTKYLSRPYRDDRAKEFASHGLSRRLGILVHAINNVWEALPPELAQIPERDKILDASICIQAFVLNVFGCLDNLAWIWVRERDVRGADGRDLDWKKVGLGRGNKEVRKSFSDDFLAYLDERQPWFDHIKGFRDALAHRIPLYIPPYIVTPNTIDEYNRLERLSAAALGRGDTEEYARLQAEQKKTGTFRPWMTHSQLEMSPAVVFHQQILQDYMTVDEIGQKMLIELDP